MSLVVDVSSSTDLCGSVAVLAFCQLCAVGSCWLHFCAAQVAHCCRKREVLRCCLHVVAVVSFSWLVLRSGSR
uniref:Putative membrane protein n=1 Tax=Hyaloperonospora parasitica TaxID=123356 RepID=A2T2J7_9STRA|nr:putative membrane protein [Hyaloperonospora parasitica]